MIEVLYHGSFRDNKPLTRLSSILNRAAAHGPPDMRKEITTFDQKIHILYAKAHAVANRFGVPKLRNLAVASFVEAILDQNFTLRDLVETIDMIYSTTILGNDELHKWLVFLAQQSQQILSYMPTF